MMKATEIRSCYIGPQISPEQFITEHFFLYLITGSITAYDGDKEYKIRAGDYGIVRRNHLVKYNKKPNDDKKFEKVVIIFDQEFLKTFNRQYKYETVNPKSKNAIIRLNNNYLVENFIQSLNPYFNNNGTINPDFSN